MKPSRMIGCLLLLPLGAGCSSLQKINAEEFLARAQEARMVHSAKWITFLGAGAERAYLEEGTLVSARSLLGGGPKVTVYWTPLKDLPEDIEGTIRQGGNPWAREP